MFTVYLDKEAMKKEKEIRELIDDQLLHNCNLNGDDYTIESSDFTYLDNIEETTGTILLNSINDIINQ